MMRFAEFRAAFTRRVALAACVGVVFALLASACGALPEEGGIGDAEPGASEQAVMASCHGSGYHVFDLGLADGPQLTLGEFAETPQGRALEQFFSGDESGLEGGSFGEADGFSIVSGDYVLGYRDGEILGDFLLDGDFVRGWGGCNPTLVRGDQTASQWRIAEPVDPGATTIPILVEGGGCKEDGELIVTTEIVEVDVQDADPILVTVWTRGLPGPEMCAGVGIDLEAEVVLASPLGDRELLDAGRIPPLPVDRETQSRTTTTARSSTTTTAPVESASSPPPEDLFTRCGAAEFPLGTTEMGGEPLDDDAREALATLAKDAEGVRFTEVFEWTLASSTGDEMALMGVTDDESGGERYAFARFVRDGDGWHHQGFGTCHPETFTTRPGYVAGHWILDPDVEPDPESSILHVWVMERACAGGQPPEGRDIAPVVEADAESLTITVLVEQVKGVATCPGNPWYPATFDLGEPIGDRALVDGRVRPGLVRPWPPTETSLEAWGDDA